MNGTRRLEGPSARLEQVDLRTVWSHEAEGFTPWLAQADNLDLLGETLGLTLEVEAVEKSLGSFRADIVCREEAGSYVLIENQLERTNHDHLGKLLTYAASLEAVTVVWLAATFREEHRAVLDWLNRITPEEYRFFGVEIEVWRIGDSPEAPKFNVVSMPNDWSRSVAATVDDRKLSEGRLSQLEYWAGLQSTLDAHNGRVAGNRKPQPQGWMAYPIGRSGFHLGAAMGSGPSRQSLPDTQTFRPTRRRRSPTRVPFGSVTPFNPRRRWDKASFPTHEHAVSRTTGDSPHRRSGGRRRVQRGVGGAVRAAAAGTRNPIAAQA